MEWIVNFFNRTVDIGSWLISCIAIYVVMLPAVLMPLIMGQQLLFFNKKKFSKFQSLMHFYSTSSQKCPGAQN